MPDRSPPSGPSATEELRVARIGDRSVTYVLRRSGRARGLRLTVDRTRGVVATVPLARRGSWARPHGAVEAFLVQRAGWVERHLARFERERALLAERGRVVDGGLLRYRGELHRLRVGTAGPRDGSPVQRRQDAQDDEAVLRRG
ncbi:MAG TPA: hypothetical protein VNJ28_05410, partial [Candidatus Limnocylindrales bacterium]|nr:hypothetical protein [Candidatus Limnocylindrales bacterium]